MKLFCRARELRPTDSTYVQNAGHAFLQCQNYESALAAFEIAVTIAATGASGTASTQNLAAALCGLGFSKHLLGDLDGAIEAYHKALANGLENSLFAHEMLSQAVREAADMYFN